jgi:tetratricopeptide (TPR) repeat protein
MNWEESRSEFKHAIKLNPNYPETFYHYAQLLDVLRERKEARSMMNKAIKMNPSQPDYRYWSADLYYNDGKFNESISEARKNLELTPGHRNTYPYLINSYFRIGDEQKAFETMQEYLSLSSDKEAAERNMKWAKEIYDSAGFKGLLNKLIEAYPENYFINATRYAKLGKMDEAIGCLEKAYENHEPAFFRINNCYDFNFLRSDPRFQVILEKLGLSDYQ